MITRKAYAKINLGLDVTGRRDDGYHIVRMIMQNVDIYDTLTFEKNDLGKIRLTANKDTIPTDEHNLIYKVCALLMEKYDIKDGVDVHLEKRIPVAAGMAGGSTDGAAAFYGMKELFDLPITQEEMCEMAVKLGADIPYCIMGGTMLSEGIGEVLTALPDMPDCYILVGKPDINVSTGWVYTELDSKEIEFHPDIDGMCDAIGSGDLGGVCQRLSNVLEPVTKSKYDIIGKIEALMEDGGAVRSIMTGSGPTVFGIFDDEDKLKKAYDKVKESGYCPELFMSKPVNPKY
ncbi:4-diphosphocytidyl-2-C-methyl-D-erythritol kinase [Butyrivibrio fibrisolvens DSM 3071]|uniref:4-diphosphocytidyl-2-C-methyl-D-erythritol kinase n=1 Tax=Butyrivibrio fibrisolvens DSM 3071 TaxID=1121131 RepID=A0A1M6B696_BUTFI|nr:4-(cytidine 5'-diphospho)-2-C-methyl-D-erythritol kinase [Butyrivibrio fibrisolvens]SHI44098.1 4-diphosphocytidyl-2-C-methyl-D-erythritol kinase [Butyrivibrio fibrisolvens DSM 3071]